MKHQGEQGRFSRRNGVARFVSKLSLAAVAACLCATPFVAVHAQSTTGMIRGQAPAGDVVVALSISGFRRQVTVKEDGKYRIRPLPLGTYSVTLKKGDKVIDMYHRVPLTVGRAMEVNFACPHDKCAAAGNDG